MHTILIIEDEPQSRTIVLECLEAEGFQVISAENGLEGIQQAQLHLPDLIVCDIMMSELDGYGVLLTLRQQATTAMIPFIFLTAMADKDEIREGMNLGADDYLTKPCTANELLEAISARLEKRHYLEQCYSPQIPTPVESSKPATLISLTASASNDEVPNAPGKTSFHLPNCPPFKDVFDFIESHYHEPISLKEIATAANYSPAYLTTMSRRYTGQTLHYWLVERRMAAARSLLLNTNQPVSHIALKVGYKDAGHFIRQFRQSHESTPQAWRNQYRPDEQ